MFENLLAIAGYKTSHSDVSIRYVPSVQIVFELLVFVFTVVVRWITREGAVRQNRVCQSFERERVYL